MIISILLQYRTCLLFCGTKQNYSIILITIHLYVINTKILLGSIQLTKAQLVYLNHLQQGPGNEIYFRKAFMIYKDYFYNCLYNSTFYRSQLSATDLANTQGQQLSTIFQCIQLITLPYIPYTCIFKSKSQNVF